MILALNQLCVPAKTGQEVETMSSHIARLSRFVCVGLTLTFALNAEAFTGEYCGDDYPAFGECVDNNFYCNTMYFCAPCSMCESAGNALTDCSVCADEDPLPLPTAPTFGDVTCDDVVNVLDVVTMVSEVLEGGTLDAECNVPCDILGAAAPTFGDVTCDGVVNVLDIVGTVGFVLNGDWGDNASCEAASVCPDLPMVDECPGHCMSWYDGCNSCGCEDGEVSFCTEMWCEVFEDAYCTACEDGWTGENCDEDIDECEDDPCKPLETCNNTEGSFECEPAEPDFAPCTPGCMSYYDGCNTCNCMAPGSPMSMCTLMFCMIYAEPYCY